MPISRVFPSKSVNPMIMWILFCHVHVRQMTTVWRKLVFGTRRWPTLTALRSKKGVLSRTLALSIRTKKVGKELTNLFEEASDD